MKVVQFNRARRNAEEDKLRIFVDVGEDKERKGLHDRRRTAKHLLPRDALQTRHRQKTFYGVGLAAEISMRKSGQPAARIPWAHGEGDLGETRPPEPLVQASVRCSKWLDVKFHSRKLPFSS